MASTTTETPAPVEQPIVQPVTPAPVEHIPVNQETAKSSQEMLTQLDKTQIEADKLKEALAQLQAEKAERDAELEKYREAERIKEQARVEEARQQAVGVMASIKESTGLELNDQVQKGFTHIWANPEMGKSKDFFSTMASQLAEKKKMEQELAQLKQTVEDIKINQQKASNIVQTTHASIMGLKKGMSSQETDALKAADDAKQEKIGLEASKNMGFASVFASPSPSAEEMKLIGGSFEGGSAVIGVNASNLSSVKAKYAGRKIKRKPVHGYEHLVPGSLAAQDSTAAMWNWAMQQDTTGLRNNARLLTNEQDIANFSEHTQKAPGGYNKMTWYK
jgi:hypothetical protein